MLVSSEQLCIVDRRTTREQKLNAFSIIPFCRSWLANYPSMQLIKISVLQIRTYLWQYIAIWSSHRINDFSSVPCNTNSSWTASRFTLSLPKNYSWKDHHNNRSNSTFSKAPFLARSQGQETNIQDHEKSGQKSTEGLKVGKCLSPVRHKPKSHKSLYSDSIPYILNSYNQAQAYLFHIPRYSTVAHWQISDIISAFQMTFPQIIMLQSLQVVVFMVSHVDIIQQLIPSYSLWGIQNINRIAWSRFWKISQVPAKKRNFHQTISSFSCWMMAFISANGNEKKIRKIKPEFVSFYVDEYPKKSHDLKSRYVFHLQQC